MYRSMGPAHGSLSPSDRPRLPRGRPTGPRRSPGRCCRWYGGGVWMIGLTGASGRLGRLVLDRLVEHVDAVRVVALTRTPDLLRPCPVATRFADFDSGDALARAFGGIERLLLISTNVFDPCGHRIRQHTNAVQAAARAGVRHVIYTSISRAGDPAHPAAVAADHRTTEAALADSGLAYTVLRHSIYTQVAFMGLDVMLSSGLLLDN